MLPADIGPGNLPPPFADFMARLKRHGFIIGVDHYLRVRAVLDRFGATCPAHRLKSLLCPLFAVNNKQQELFQRLFDSYFGLPEPLAAETISQAKPPPASADGRADKPGAAGPSKPLWLAAGILLVALLGLILWRVIPAPVIKAPTLVVDEIPEPQLPQSQQVERKPNLRITIPLETGPAPELTFHQRWFRQIRWTGAATCLVAFILVELFRWRRRRLVLQKERLDLRRRKPPYFWQIQVDPPPMAYAKTDRFQAAAKRLRRRTGSPVRRLDLGQTIRATCARFGFPALCYKALTRPPEYLFLIDLPENRDHAAHLAAFTATALADEGLYVKRFFFRNDPRVCFEDPGQERRFLADIMDKYLHCRLILVGTGEALLDPVTCAAEPWADLFRAWPERAVLTPRPPGQWGAVELALSRDFILLPATLEGLAALWALLRKPARARLRPWIDKDHQPALPPADKLNDPDALEAYLGDHDTFQWLCACAVYPELHWQLTLALGLALHEQTRLDEARLLRLARLPWFCRGSLPAALRPALIARLDPPNLQKVRETIFQILKRNPPPDTSPAFDTYRLYLAAFRPMLDRGERKAARRDLKAALAAGPAPGALQDVTLVRFLESAAASPLGLVLPKALHKVFFKSGLPLFGLKTGVRGLFYGALAALFLALPTPDPPQTLAARQLDMEFTHIPAGTFTMGSPDDEPGRWEDEGPRHEVSLEQEVYLQTTEVTQKQWQALMGNNPSLFKNCGKDCPVEQVSWDEVQDFVARLNQVQHQGRYRLPSEAEWEYAARAGGTTAFANGAITETGCGMDPNLDAMGWYCGNSGVGYEGCFDASNLGGAECAGTHPVKQKRPNAWGLFDMHGNVWEWVADDWHDNYNGAPDKGRAWIDDPRGSGRVIRGGSWIHSAGLCRAAYRLRGVPGLRVSYFGFRLALLPGQPGPSPAGGDGGGLGRMEGRAAAGPESAEAPAGAPLEMTFVRIAPKIFMMGSPANEPGRDGDETRHKVKLTHEFDLQTTEVTQGQWQAVMGNNPSYFKNCGKDCPVENVSWEEAEAFIANLNQVQSSWQYRLPTEAEWEYAARAGGTTAFAGGAITETGCGTDPNLASMGWYCGNAGGRTHPAAQKSANAWGLYDMHGNVWEWCRDRYGKFPPVVSVDPTGPDRGTLRVVRGGSWSDDATFCRSASRLEAAPDSRNSRVGFRLVRVKVQPGEKPAVDIPARPGPAEVPSATGQPSGGRMDTTPAEKPVTDSNVTEPNTGGETNPGDTITAPGAPRFLIN